MMRFFSVTTLFSHEFLWTCQSIWVLPRMAVPPNHPLRIFHWKPSILGDPIYGHRQLGVEWCFGKAKHLALHENFNTALTKPTPHRTQTSWHGELRPSHEGWIKGKAKKHSAMAIQRSWFKMLKQRTRVFPCVPIMFRQTQITEICAQNLCASESRQPQRRAWSAAIQLANTMIWPSNSGF